MGRRIKEIKYSKYFDLHEVVPRSILDRWGSRAKEFLSPTLPDGIDFIREFFDTPMLINNWYWGGDLQYRGLRPFNSSVGASMSQHKFGRAVDFNLTGYTPDEIRAIIIENKDKFLAKGWTTLESGVYAPTWVHIDMRNNDSSTDIRIIKP